MKTYSPEEWLVDEILPTAEFHIVGGPSGGGKTTLILQMMADWQAGKPLFGHASHSRPFAYVSLDRGEKSLRRTLERCGVDPNTFPYVCPRRRKKPIAGFEDLIFNFVHPKFPKASVIVVEGIASMMTGTNNKASDYSAAFKFYGDIAALCNEEGLTVIGVMHSPKMKESERYLNPRQRLLNSVAIGGIAETIILSEPNFESPTKLDRIVTLLPRNAPEQEFRMRLDENGMHQPAPVEDSPAIAAADKELKASQIFDMALGTYKEGDEFSTGQFIKDLKDLGISERSIYNGLAQASADGRIETAGRGRWRKITPPDSYRKT
jgi:hypothetical protein